MTDIPEEFQDVPRLTKGKNAGNPDFRTKRGKELKAYLEAQESDHSALSITRAPHVEEEAGDERFPQAPQEPVQATVTAFVPSATPMPSHGVLSATEARPGKPVGEIPMPNLGTSQSGQWLLQQIAEAYPEVRYNQWNRVKATFVHAQRNLLAWRRLTKGR